MSDVSQVYTQQASTNATATGGTPNPLLAGGVPAGGSFLDLLLSVLLTSPAVVASAVTTTTTDAAPSVPVAQTTDPTQDQTGQSDTQNDDTSVIAGLNPALLMTPPVQVQTGTTSVQTMALTDPVQAPAPEMPIDPAALNAIEPGNADYTETLDARLKAQVLALLKQNGIDLPIPPAAAPVTPSVNAAAIADPATDPVQAPVLPVAPLADLSADTQPTNDVAAQLNAMNVGAGDKGDTKTETKGKPLNLLDGLLRGADAAGYQPTITTPTGAYQPNLNAKTPEQSQTMTTPANDGSDLLADDTLFQLDLSSLTPENLGSLLQANAQISQNVVKAAANGNGQSTATLNAVAIHMQAMAQNRDTRTMTLHLNPPELGKLQVKMSYGKDKTVKADVLVEKADTLSMLQKDSDALKQALNNAGLQADAGSLNFSLADQGGFDNMMGSSQGGDGNERVIGDENSDISLIEIKSSEEWSVDPKTGIVRYNIVV